MTTHRPIHVDGFDNPVIQAHTGDDRTLGQRAADAIARSAGSWGFIFCFLLLLAVWMAYNGGRGSGRFDPFPYILLNLVLSTTAALQAPVILMSQNRADAKRNELAELDYRVNRRAEAEVRVIAQILGVSASDFERRVTDEMSGELVTDRMLRPEGGSSG
jgi:uncharacterized membrane protein